MPKILGGVAVNVIGRDVIVPNNKFSSKKNPALPSEEAVYPCRAGKYLPYSECPREWGQNGGHARGQIGVLKTERRGLGVALCNHQLLFKQYTK